MADKDTCSKCFDGYSVKDGECIKITIPHCKRMENAGVCDECEDHYGLNESKTVCGTVLNC